MEPVSLPSGFSMPAVGYGTWQQTDEAQLEAALDKALEVGYRHIDTATAYQNEHVIGRVLNRWFTAGKLKREDVFVTTKLPIFGIRPTEVNKWIETSKKNLQLDYLDLYLVHVPFGAFLEDGKFIPDMSTDLVAVWREMEKQVDAKHTRYIGVSNFNEKQVGRILEIARIPPVTNQVELHIYLQQNKLVEYLRKNQITTTAYSSLGTPGSQQMFRDVLKSNIKVPNILENPVVLEIAKKNGKTPAQILLRQIVQRGITVLPKSTNAHRIEENFKIQDWSLDSEDMAKLAALNKDARILEFKNLFDGFAEHPEYPF